MNSTLLLISLTLAMTCGLASAKPNKSNPEHVRIQTFYFEVGQKSLSPLLAAPPREPLYQAIRNLTAQGEAKLIHLTLMTCRSGEMSSTESVREVIYPTEYEPQELSCHGSIGIGGTVKPQPPNKTPTAFETRNVGDTLEIGPVISKNGKHIELRLQQEILTHPKDNVWKTHKDEHGTTLHIFPEFDLQRFSTQVTLRNGRPRLITSYTPHNAEGKPDTNTKIFVFVKATVIAPK